MRKVCYDYNGQIYLEKIEETHSKTTWNGDISKLPKVPKYKRIVNGKEV